MAMPLMRCLRQAWCWSTGVVGTLFWNGYPLSVLLCFIMIYFGYNIYCTYEIHTQNLLLCLIIIVFISVKRL